MGLSRGFAVRRDWDADSSHDFVEFRVDADDARMMRDAQRDQWARSAAPPVLSVAEIDAGLFERHRSRSGCSDSSCPVDVTGRHALASAGEAAR